MAIFITTGTYEYLERIVEKYPEENLFLMENDNNALIIHETNNKTIFNYPQNYQIIKSYGSFNNEQGFYVFDYLPTTSEGKLILEHYLNKISLENTNLRDAEAIRILLPEKNHPFIILTMWRNRDAYNSWLEKNQLNRTYDNVIKNKQFIYDKDVFSSPSYSASYEIRQDEDEDENGENEIEDNC